MKLLCSALGTLLYCYNSAGYADPLTDQQQIRKIYQQRFPELSFQQYADGVYAIDAIARESWQAIEEFPPYEPAIERGQKAFDKTFPNGGHYSDCLPLNGIGIAQAYPRWDKRKKRVVTLAKAINDCRTDYGYPPLPYGQGKLADILSFLVYTSQDKTIKIKNPAKNRRALAAYTQGKAFFYQRRGQLNFSCATCHIQNAGKRIRSEWLSPSLGHTSHWPTYRLKWGEMHTLHRRFIECSKQILAPTFKPQSIEYSNLEYFLSFISNGIKINGPSVRK